MQMHAFVLPITIGILAGVLTRLLLIQTTYRQFPSSPHGLIIHIFLGAVGSLLGALVIPAVLKPDFTAGVFVSIGAAQFHTMRGLERQAWTDLDKGEPVPRGPAYIDGMATAFEARIFLVLGVSALTTLCAFFFHWVVGVVAGLLLAIMIRVWKQGKTLSDMADVERALVAIHDNVVTVGKLAVARINTEDSSESDAVSPDDILALVVRPRDFSGVLTLGHHGQQQALLHNLSVAVGVQTEAAMPPTVRYYPKDRQLVVTMMPVIMDETLAVKSLLGAPILEGVFRKRIPEPSRPSNA